MVEILIMFAQIAHDVWIPTDIALGLALVIFCVIALIYGLAAWIDFATNTRNARMLESMPMAKTLEEYRRNMAYYGVCGYYAEDLAEEFLKTEETK